MVTTAKGTNRDKQGKSFVESPLRGEKWTAQEVVIANDSSMPISVTNTGNELFEQANVNISALKCVTKEITGVNLADKDAQITAEVLGITRSAANTGNSLRVVTHGRIDDTTFNFNVNEPLFLGDNGNITNLSPSLSGEYITRIGYGLGAGSIFVEIEQPTLIE